MWEFKTLAQVLVGMPQLLPACARCPGILKISRDIIMTDPVQHICQSDLALYSVCVMLSICIRIRDIESLTSTNARVIAGES